MRIKNLTSEVQPLKVLELSGGRELTIYVEGKGYTDLVDVYLKDCSVLGKTFEIVTPSFEKQILVMTEEASDDTDNKEEEIPSKDQDTQEEKSADSLESKFICDICGAEFGSAKGLASHKTRSHPAE